MRGYEESIRELELRAGAVGDHFTFALLAFQRSIPNNLVTDKSFGERD